MGHSDYKSKYEGYSRSALDMLSLDIEKALLSDLINGLALTDKTKKKIKTLVANIELLAYHEGAGNGYC